MWGNLLARRFPHTLSKNSLAKKHKETSVSKGQTVRKRSLVGVGLAVAWSCSRSDSPPDCHSFRSRRFATSRATRENKRIPQNKQPACHSERRKTLAFCAVEVLRVERSEQAKPRSDSDEGIWLGVLVVFCNECNIPLASHRDL